ncbi:MAG: RNA helicase [Betaproteobacteria bacterium HGW-Betaproteobacteria-10]|nr:MAG: RNA helicase [Betaproteobacteria bacterium HGW-Betaproteobacteria-10]
MQFTDLGLKAELLRAIGEQGYDTPTPIQQKAIPAVMAGHDLMASAQTGTGKTAGFTLPILHRLASGPNTRTSKRPRVLVLVPTRELAIQVEVSVSTYGKHLPINSVAVFGGVGINPQIAALRRGVDILVATPGRLLDHVQQRTVDLSGIEILVLDEADRMLDMGFIRDIRKLIALLPKQRQNLMFSATFSPDIRELASGLLTNPVSVDVAARNTAAETVTQRVIETNRDQKKDLLLHLFETRGWNQVLIFARTKHGADALSKHLDKAGIKSAALHGNKSQGARTRALADFKDGKLVALVATDIAARGIDIDSLPYVINYEIPNISEDYVHRIGRTGRAGMEGEAISLVGHDERGFMRDIERLIKRQIEREVVEGFEPSAIAPPRPVQPQRGARKPSAPSKSAGQKTAQNRGGPQQHRSGTRHH